MSIRQMTWYNKLFVSIVIAGFITTAIVLVAGIATHKEAGLIPGVPKWHRSDFPLGISAVAYTSEGDVTPDSYQIDAVSYMAKVVNHRLGFHAVKWPVTGGAKISITLGVPMSVGTKDPNGHSEIVHTGDRAELCRVTTSNVPPGVLWLVLYHEIGHCFGLAHDDFTLSIMRDPIKYPLQEPASDQIPPWFTDFDRKLLRKMYAP